MSAQKLLMGLLGALVLAWGTAGAAWAGQEAVTSGMVTATLDYGPDPLNTAGATLTISRAGVTGVVRTFVFDRQHYRLKCAFQLLLQTFGDGS